MANRPHSEQDIQPRVYYSDSDEVRVPTGQGNLGDIFVNFYVDAGVSVAIMHCYNGVNWIHILF
jgi:hypothetical protein